MRDEVLPELTPDLIKDLARRFDETPKYRYAEESLRWLIEQKPRNEELWPVLLKVVAVNGLYSTQIYGVFEVAQHIVKLPLDDLLAEGAREAVEILAPVEIGGKKRRLYSFASKYCSWHRPDAYPLMDSVVKEVLWKYRRQLGQVVKRKNLDTYAGFCSALEAFAEHFGLDGLAWKELDKGLWTLGKQWLSA